MTKRLLFPTFFLLCTLPLFSQKKPAPTTPTVLDLATALTQKLIAVEMAGTGGHQGACVKVSGRSLTGKTLRVRIPQGQFVEPADSAMQTLVVAEGQIVAFSPKTPVEVLLKTFCAQAGDSSPREGIGFAVGAVAPEQLRKLLQFIVEQGKVDDGAAQSAVWCVTSGSSLAGIGDPELTKFTAALVGREAPTGYRVRYETRTIRPGERAAPGKALVVEGHYNYYLAEDAKVVMLLLDSDGKLIKQVSKEKVMVAGEHRGSFNLEVYNLPPGHYIVRIQTSTGEVIKDTKVEF